MLRSLHDLEKYTIVEIFRALRLHIDSSGPGAACLVTALGKMPANRGPRGAGAAISPPQNLFGDSAARDDAIYVRLHVSPHSTIALAARVTRAGKELVGEQCELTLLEEAPAEQSPYERLLTDTMAGDGALFAAKAPSKPPGPWSIRYWSEHPPAIVDAPGTWGPPEADQFIAAGGRCRNPEFG